MSRLRALSIVLPVVLLAGCFTGERPYFSDDPFTPGSSSGDTTIDVVLAKFDAAVSGPFTAGYNVLTKFGNVTRAASVASEPGRRSIIIGTVRFVQTDTLSETCTLDGTRPCIDGLDVARISDTGVTIEFYAAEAARRLRRDAQAKIGPPVAHNETIAGQTATCVDVPLAGGTAIYCALDIGIVAKLDDGDVLVMLAQLLPTVDEAAFELSH